MKPEELVLPLAFVRLGAGDGEQVERSGQIAELQDVAAAADSSVSPPKMKMSPVSPRSLEPLKEIRRPRRRRAVSPLSKKIVSSPAPPKSVSLPASPESDFVRAVAAARIRSSAGVPPGLKRKRIVSAACRRQKRLVRPPRRPTGCRRRLRRRGVVARAAR